MWILPTPRGKGAATEREEMKRWFRIIQGNCFRIIAWALRYIEINSFYLHIEKAEAVILHLETWLESFLLLNENYYFKLQQHHHINAL